MSGSGAKGAIAWNDFGYKFRSEGPFQRVTTIKAKKSTGKALIDWAARMVANEAARIGAMLASGQIDAESAAIMLADPALAKVHNAVRDTAADFGTVFHELAEAVALGDGNALHYAEDAIRMDGIRQYADTVRAKVGKSAKELNFFYQHLTAHEKAECQCFVERGMKRLWPDVEAFLDWESAVKPKWIRNEFQVFNRRYNYAGSVDALVEIGGKTLILDFKTSKGVYADYALQLAAYRYAEFIGEHDGTETPMPKVDGGCILHVRDGQCQLLELQCDEAVARAFGACKKLYDFDRMNLKPRPFEYKVSVPA